MAESSLARLTVLKSSLFLGQTTNTFDDVLKALLISQTKVANDYTQRTIDADSGGMVSKTYAPEIYTREPGGENRLYLNHWPVTTLTKVEFWNDSDEAYEDVTASDYTLRKKRYIRYPALGKESTADRSTFKDGEDKIRVTYVGGYITTDWDTKAVTFDWTVPEDLEHAICDMAQIEFEKGKDGNARRGVSSITLGIESMTLDTTRFVKGLPESVTVVLDRYKRLVL